MRSVLSTFVLTSVSLLGQLTTAQSVVPGSQNPQMVAGSPQYQNPQMVASTPQYQNTQAGTPVQLISDQTGGTGAQTQSIPGMAAPNTVTMNCGQAYVIMSEADLMDPGTTSNDTSTPSTVNPSSTAVPNTGATTGYGSPASTPVTVGSRLRARALVQPTMQTPVTQSGYNASNLNTGAQIQGGAASAPMGAYQTQGGAGSVQGGATEYFAACKGENDDFGGLCDPKYCRGYPIATNCQEITITGPNTSQMSNNVVAQVACAGNYYKPSPTDKDQVTLCTDQYQKSYQCKGPATGAAVCENCVSLKDFQQTQMGSDPTQQAQQQGGQGYTQGYQTSQGTQVQGTQLTTNQPVNTTQGGYNQGSQTSQSGQVQGAQLTTNQPANTTQNGTVPLTTV